MAIIFSLTPFADFYLKNLIICGKAREISQMVANNPKNSPTIGCFN